MKTAEFGIDLSNLRSAYVDPAGQMYEVPAWSHQNWALEHQKTESHILDKTWVHISGGCVYAYNDRVTQPQYDFLFEYFAARNKIKELEQFTLS